MFTDTWRCKHILSYKHCPSEGLSLWCLPASPECSGNTHSFGRVQMYVTCLQTHEYADTFSLAGTVIVRHCSRIMTRTMSALYQFSIGTFGFFSRTWLLWQCSACASCWRHTHTSTTAVTSSRFLCPSWPTDIQRPWVTFGCLHTHTDTLDMHMLDIHKQTQHTHTTQRIYTVDQD